MKAFSFNLTSDDRECLLDICCDKLEEFDNMDLEPCEYDMEIKFLKKFINKLEKLK